MATVVVAPAALEDLASLIRTHSLPTDTGARVRRAIEPLRTFPLLGARLVGPWSSFRFVLGPWRWMLIVYTYEQADDRVAVVTIQDARSGRSPTAGA